MGHVEIQSFFFPKLWPEMLGERGSAKPGPEIVIIHSISLEFHPPPPPMLEFKAELEE